MRKVNKSDSPQQQTNCVCRFLSEITDIEASQFETAFDYFTCRVRAALSYTPSSTIKGHIFFIRTEVNIHPLTESYGLEKVKNQIIFQIRIN